ncbi:hypothetical protein H9P43_004121 [Blastocladiella emersonii ATCC 22665]|nr:hypothetical protein H9P43_004121 [Blastocladiella emersonii ATCC 22665]
MPAGATADHHHPSPQGHPAANDAAAWKAAAAAHASAIAADHASSRASSVSSTHSGSGSMVMAHPTEPMAVAPAATGTPGGSPAAAATGAPLAGVPMGVPPPPVDDDDMDLVPKRKRGRPRKMVYLVSGVNILNQSHTTEEEEREQQRLRRASHNVIERRRRDQINQSITDLSELLPYSIHQGAALNKANTLRMTVDFVRQLVAQTEELLVERNVMREMLVERGVDWKLIEVGIAQRRAHHAAVSGSPVAPKPDPGSPLIAPAPTSAASSPIVGHSVAQQQQQQQQAAPVSLPGSPAVGHQTAVPVSANSSPAPPMGSALPAPAAHSAVPTSGDAPCACAGCGTRHVPGGAAPPQHQHASAPSSPSPASIVPAPHRVPITMADGAPSSSSVYCTAAPSAYYPAAAAPQYQQPHQQPAFAMSAAAMATPTPPTTPLPHLLPAQPYQHAGAAAAAAHRAIQPRPTGVIPKTSSYASLAPATSTAATAAARFGPSSSSFFGGPAPFGFTASSFTVSRPEMAPAPAPLRTLPALAPRPPAVLPPQSAPRGGPAAPPAATGAAAGVAWTTNGTGGFLN